MDRVTVLIFTCDRPEDLTRCLISVLAQTYKDYDILIVNNGESIDDIIRDKPVRVINDRTKKLSYLFNLGWRNSSGELIAYLADDAQVSESWLREGLNTLSAGALVAVATGPLVSPYEFTGLMHKLYSGAKRSPLLRPLAKFYDSFILEGKTFQPCVLCQSGSYTLGQGFEPDFVQEREVDLATTSSMIIRRSAIKRIGGFDENFYFNHADGDLFIRLKKKGFKIVYNPRMRAIHYNRMGPSRGAFIIGRDTAYFYLKDIRPRSLRAVAAALCNIFILNAYWVISSIASCDIRQLGGIIGFFKGIFDFLKAQAR